MIINRCGGSSGAKDAYNCKHMKHMHVCISILRILKHQVVDMSVTVSMVLRILNILLPFSMVLTKKTEGVPGAHCLHVLNCTKMWTWT